MEETQTKVIRSSVSILNVDSTVGVIPEATLKVLDVHLFIEIFSALLS